MSRNVLSKEKARRLAVVAALSACLFGGGLALAQTKQLKEPAAPVQATGDEAKADAPAIAPGSNDSSYSIVVESKTDKDGKVVRSKKVWKNGVLVEDEEKTLDGADAGDATVQLPDGQIAPGGIFRSDEFKDAFGEDGDASPFETMRKMEDQMREQFDQLRKQLQNGQANGAFAFPNGGGFFAPLDPNAESDGSAAPVDGVPFAAPSKYWIGATVEPTPAEVVAQLPIDEGQGILIQAIIPDSPAAKAGLNRYDVVVKIDGEAIASAADVAKVVDKAEAKEVGIEYYRKGKLTEGTLTPAERPQLVDDGTLTAPFAPGATTKRFRIVRPGTIIPNEAAQKALEDAQKAAEEQAQKLEEQAKKVREEAQKAVDAAKAAVEQAQASQDAAANAPVTAAESSDAQTPVEPEKPVESADAAEPEK